MIPHDLFDWTNSGAGVAGLVLTAGAIWQATGAKRAATEARKAVNKRNAADAMVEVVRIAEQLNTSVLYERPLEGSLQLRELVFRIPKDREEIAKLLTSDADRLRSIESDCKRWTDYLGHGTFPLGSVSKQSFFNETFDAVQELNAIQGRLCRKIDEEEK